MAATPSVSVILLIGRRRKRSARALNSVLQQEGTERAEVLLVDTAPQEPALSGSDHAQVKLIQVQERGTYGAMRGDAVRLARAPIVVFVEDHCVVCPGWLMAIEAAFEGPWAAVGPRILNANAGIGVSNAIHFINYGHWTEGSGRGPVGLIAGHNSAYRRDVLIGLGSDLDSLLLSDTLLQWRLAKQGHQFFYEPAAYIGHLYPTSLAIALRDVFFYHRCFGALRVQFDGWPASKRAAHTLLWPAIPLVRVVRISAFVARKRSYAFPELIRNLHWLGILTAGLAAGQALGVARGMGNAADMFTEYELDEHRAEGADPFGCE